MSAKWLDRTKSLEELERAEWGEPTYDSYLVTTVHALRRKPLKGFTAEDLRIMIGQNVGLEYLIPLAVEHLSVDPLTRGDCHPGDLLKNVIGVEPQFWADHSELWWAVEEIVTDVELLSRTIVDIVLPVAARFRRAKPVETGAGN